MNITKNKKNMIITIACGLLCALCVVAYMISVKAEADDARNSALAKYGGEQIEVCVAKRDLSAGETIDSSSIEMKLWLADLLPDAVVRNSNEIIGKQLTSAILAGEVISNKRFQENTMSIEVPAGLSAVSVPAKDVSSVGGSLSAGMHIDVYATGNITTSLIAQNVLVLATSTTITEKSNSSSVSWITLAVKPDMVQELVAASQTTSLYFTLPSEDSRKDEDSSNSKSISGSNTKDKDSISSPGASEDFRSKYE